MKKFKFRFLTVLEVRRKREEEARRMLSTAQRAHQLELAKKAALQRNLGDALFRRERLMSDTESADQGIGILPVHLEQKFIEGTKQRIIQADQAIVRAVRGVEKALRFYLHAKKQLQIMETLHDKDFSEYKKKSSKLEARELDDFNIMRARVLAQELEMNEVLA